MRSGQVSSKGARRLSPASFAKETTKTRRTPGTISR
jgi:hypothetical protein